MNSLLARGNKTRVLSTMATLHRHQKVNLGECIESQVKTASETKKPFSITKVRDMRLALISLW